jgi:hypothetical protein
LTERYLPVPVWERLSRWWVPLDFRAGQRLVEWPEGFDPHTLPLPEYRAGDRVQFVRDETCAREGTVRYVLLQGGSYHSLEERDALIQRWYLDAEAMTYIVTARGHDHRIKQRNILGRFISLDHLARIRPR